MKVTLLSLILTAMLFVLTVSAQPHSYTWLPDYDTSQSIIKRIPVPSGYERVVTSVGTFEDWLQHLPLKKGNPPVYLHNGEKKINQTAHFAVVNLDVGSKDLQQCADAVMRLRAEYLFSTGKYETIHFNFTSGDRVDFTRWTEGYRPVIRGNKVVWIKNAARDTSYRNFKEYLEKIFTYAGTASLSRELKSVSLINNLKIGDVFIQGGFPGHAVIVVDMAVNKSGKKLFLLAQSYMPAQDLHILKNPTDYSLSPWYNLDFGETLETPEWAFRKTDLKRF
ncbi:MAG: DUF4846 domain-containing protein [Acidobacteriota bacterium]